MKRVGDKIPIAATSPFLDSRQPLFAQGGRIYVRYRGKHSSSMNPQIRFAAFRMADIVGKGTFGQCYRATSYKLCDKTPPSLVCKTKNKLVKVYAINNPAERKLIQKLASLRQRLTHLSLKNPVFVNNNYQMAYLVMRLLPGKSLGEHIKDKRIHILSETQKLKLTYKLLIALRDQVAAQDLVHRDIKPDNILVQIEPDILVNIIDFDFVKETGTEDYKSIGTYMFMAPEIFARDASHDKPCDVFSMGRLLSELWCDISLIFDPKTVEEARDCAINAAAKLKPHISPELFQLIGPMLDANPKTRATINEAIGNFIKIFPDYICTFPKFSQSEINRGTYSISSRNNFFKQVERETQENLTICLKNSLN